MATNSDSSWVDKELGEMVGKVLDHSTNRMPGEVQIYKMYIEKAKQKILQKMDEAEESKDTAYWERNQLVAFMTHLYPSWIGYHDGKDWEDDWRTIIYIKTPAGQLSWHIHDDDKQYFTHLDPGLEEWDGHTTAVKYNRINALAQLKSLESKVE